MLESADLLKGSADEAAAAFICLAHEEIIDSGIYHFFHDWKN